MNVIIKAVVTASTLLMVSFSSFETSAQSPLLKEQIESIVIGKKSHCRRCSVGA